MKCTSPTLQSLERLWSEADEDANAAIDAGDQDRADRAIVRQEVIADLIDELKEKTSE